MLTLENNGVVNVVQMIIILKNHEISFGNI